MTDTTDTKSVLRRRLIADRIAASAARPEAGERLVDHFAPNWRPRAGMVVAGYHPLPHEIDVIVDDGDHTWFAQVCRSPWKAAEATASTHGRR